MLEVDQEAEPDDAVFVEVESDSAEEQPSGEAVLTVEAMEVDSDDNTPGEPKRPEMLSLAG